MSKVEKEPKLPLPLKISKSLLEWIREQSSKENRSINNWIETKLFQIKELHELVSDAEPVVNKTSKWQERLDEMRIKQEQRLKDMGK